MFIVGQTLVWHDQTPTWFFEDAQGRPTAPDARIERMRAHVQAVVGRDAGRIHGWDVVKEVVDNDGRPTTWVRGIGSGEGLVRLAVRFASRYAPGAEPYSNDVNARRLALRGGTVRLVRAGSSAGRGQR
jgi:endo-1,4-beta-xylanase